MKIIVIGSTGVIGAAVARALGERHDVVGVSRHSNPAVDIENPPTIAAMFDRVKDVDAVVCCAGTGAFKTVDQLTDQDLEDSLRSKLMGQVHVIRQALVHLRDRGSVTVTTGVLARQPIPGSAAISMINCGLEGFARGAALDAKRGIRINVVSPPWMIETLVALKMDLTHGMPAAIAAKTYVAAVEGSSHGEILDCRHYT